MVVIDEFDGDGRRVQARIRTGQDTSHVWFSSDEPLAPRPEAFLVLALAAAMHRGEPLRVSAPVCPELLNQLHRVQAIYQAWNPALRNIVIEASESGPEVRESSAQALFFTGGVDSLAAALEHPEAALVYVHGFDLALGQKKLREEVRNRLAAAAGELGRPYVELETNVRDFSDRWIPWQFGFGASLAACAWVLSKRFTEFLVSTSFGTGPDNDPGEIHPDGSDPELVSALGGGAVELRATGAEHRRIDKVKSIASNPVAHRHLRVCWENRGGTYNCGSCDKCLRTMSALAALGKLDLFQVFEEPLVYRRLERSVPVHEHDWQFVRENIKAAETHGADQQLIDSLQASLASPMAWFWRLHAQHTPRALKDWSYRCRQAYGKRST